MGSVQSGNFAKIILPPIPWWFCQYRAPVWGFSESVVWIRKAGKQEWIWIGIRGRWLFVGLGKVGCGLRLMACSWGELRFEPISIFDLLGPLLRIRFDPTSTGRNAPYYPKWSLLPIKVLIKTMLPVSGWNGYEFADFGCSHCFGCVARRQLWLL